ncbi:hypothetical protein, partial [Xanthomonas oryzae]
MQLPDDAAAFLAAPAGASCAHPLIAAENTNARACPVRRRLGIGSYKAHTSILLRYRYQSDVARYILLADVMCPA